MYQDDAPQNPKKLFVGNLPFRMTEEDLTELFAPYGDLVSVKLVIDRMSGRSRGIAFVEYAAEDAAQAAIEALHESEVEGRAMIVNVARPPRPRTDRPDYNRGGNGGNGGGYGRRPGGFSGGRSSGGYGGGSGYGGGRGGYRND